MCSTKRVTWKARLTYITATNTNISNPYNNIMRISYTRHLSIFKFSLMWPIQQTRQIGILASHFFANVECVQRAAEAIMCEFLNHDQ